MTVAIDNVLASLAVKRLAASGPWYTRLIGRDGASPMPGLLEWTFPRGGGLQVYEAPPRAGEGSCTLAVPDLAAVIARLDEMGVDTSQRTSNERVKTVMVVDLDGNHLAFAQAADPSLAR